VTPQDWFDDELQSGGRLSLADARGSYHAWLVGRREPAPQAVRDDGKRWLRKQGYKVRRIAGASMFDGVSLKDPGTAPTRRGASQSTNAADPGALAALVGLVRPRDLDQAALRLFGGTAYLCSACGRITRHADRRHVKCR
jgi:hypothetical protein